MADKAVGFTPKQRRWFLERDNHQCMFWFFRGGKWVRCPRKSNLQIHHLTPRGYASLHYPVTFELNGASNGLSLCPMHHVATNYTGDPIFVVHPDTEVARIAYIGGDKDAYKKMMDARRKLNEAGLPYWNTTWDHMFHRLVEKANARYLPGHPYPGHRKYGTRGR